MQVSLFGGTFLRLDGQGTPEPVAEHERFRAATRARGPVYPMGRIVEFYFPGFDPAYSGTDWKALRLVFERKDERWFLIGVIHSE